MPEFNKIGCFVGKSVKAKEAFKALRRKYKFENVTKECNRSFDLIIVLGGDGELLRAMHKYMNLNIPFYGINMGSLGFLLNSYDPVTLFERLSTAVITKLHPLKMDATNKLGQKFSAIAINEVCLFRQSNQTAKISIELNGIMRMKELIADGVLVSTPAGSSAYNLSAGGPIVPLGSNVLSLTPICPFRPRRWQGAILPHNSVIDFHVLDNPKRPVNVTVDFQEFFNVTHVSVTEIRKKTIKLLFDDNHSLEDKIIKEQFAG